MAPPSRLDRRFPQIPPDQPDAAALQALPAECQEHVKTRTQFSCRSLLLISPHAFRLFFPGTQIAGLRRSGVGPD